MKWISVKDRLPEQNIENLLSHQKYIIHKSIPGFKAKCLFSGKEDEYKVEMAYWGFLKDIYPCEKSTEKLTYGITWGFIDEHQSFHKNVLHWMPFPEPPLTES